jgi:endonuclease YncB( thermonuclease family)
MVKEMVIGYSPNVVVLDETYRELRSDANGDYIKVRNHAFAVYGTDGCINTEVTPFTGFVTKIVLETSREGDIGFTEEVRIVVHSHEGGQWKVVFDDTVPLETPSVEIEVNAWVRNYTYIAVCPHVRAAIGEVTWYIYPPRVYYKEEEEEVSVRVYLDPPSPKVGEPFALKAEITNNTDETKTLTVCPSDDFYGLPCQKITLSPHETRTVEWRNRVFSEVREYKIGVCADGYCDSITYTPAETDWVSGIISAFQSGFEAFVEYMEQFAGAIQDLAEAAHQILQQSIEDFVEFIDWLIEWSAEKVWEVVDALCKLIDCNQLLLDLLNLYTDLYSKVRTVEQAKGDAEFYADLLEKLYYNPESVEYVEMRVGVASGAIGRVLGSVSTVIAAIGLESLIGWGLCDNFLATHSMIVYNLMERNMWEAAKEANDKLQYSIAVANIIMVVTAGVVSGLAFKNVDRRQQTLFKSYKNYATKYGKPIGAAAIAWALAFYYMYVFKAYQLAHDKYEILIYNKLGIPWTPPGVGEESGVLYITSEPTNALIYVWQDGEWKATQMVTPARIRLPVGRQRIKLYTIDWRGYEYEAVVDVDIPLHAGVDKHVVLSKKLAIPERFEGTVVEVRDKGTIMVYRDGVNVMVRLAGLDMPQLFSNSLYCSQCVGSINVSWKDWLDKCKSYLATIVEGEEVIVLSDDSRKTVREWDSVSENEVDKLLAVVIRKKDNVNVNLEVIKYGYACCNLKPNLINKHVDKGKFLEAGAFAIERGYGLFSVVRCPKRSITVTSYPAAKVYVDRRHIA